MCELNQISYCYVLNGHVCGRVFHQGRHHHKLQSGGCGIVMTAPAIIEKQIEDYKFRWARISRRSRAGSSWWTNAGSPFVWNHYHDSGKYRCWHIHLCPALTEQLVCCWTKFCDSVEIEQQAVGVRTGRRDQVSIEDDFKLISISLVALWALNKSARDDNWAPTKPKGPISGRWSGASTRRRARRAAGSCYCDTGSTRLGLYYATKNCATQSSLTFSFHS